MKVSRYYTHVDQDKLKIIVDERLENFGTEEIEKMLLIVNDTNSFSFDQAPEGTKAWTITAGGTANWWNSHLLETNCRYDDWQPDHRRTKQGEVIRTPAPDFGFNVANWQKSLIVRDDRKFKVTIRVDYDDE